MSESSGGGGGVGGGPIARVACWIAKPGAGIFLLGAALAFGVIVGATRSRGTSVDQNAETIQ